MRALTLDRRDRALMLDRRDRALTLDRIYSMQARGITLESCILDKV